MWKIRSSVEIDASCDAVFATLTDYKNLPQWSTFIQKLEGTREVGERLKVELRLPGSKKNFDLSPKLLAYNPGKEFRWRGGSKGFYTGEHFFVLHPINAHKCRLEHGEDFKGILVPISSMGSMNRNASIGFDNFNSALKDRAEKLDLKLQKLNSN
jgi:hypothetical protein